MQAVLKAKIEAIIKKHGREKANQILDDLGVAQSTREKLFAGAYEHKPKKMLSNILDLALKKGA